MATSDKLRQSNSRAAKKQWLADRGAVKVPLVLFRSENEAAQRVCAATGLTDTDKLEDMFARLLKKADEALG